MPLAPGTPGEVRIYTCGPTVYDHAHIGNFRSFLFEDLLRRTLEHFGWTVRQVMNLTDVDDKTIGGAQRAGVGLDEFTAPYIESFFEDLDTLHLERAESYPRATRHVPEMIALIERLVERGAAYERDGSIFFRIAEDPDYGRLSGIDLEGVRRGDRVADDDYGKEDARDFVLWKGAKEGEPSWDSPWGPGRPGWHIECSAMSMKYLGQTLDLHCGGVDNIFPHHENEIAQSETATGEPFVRHWMHAEYLIVEGEKMSKRLGNFYTVKDLLGRGVSPRALRYLLVATHYRNKLNFTFDGLADAERALGRIDEMRFRLEHAVEGAGEGSAERPAVAGDGDSFGPDAASPLARAVQEARGAFDDALADDLNASKALAAVFGLVRTVNVAIEEGSLAPGDKGRVLDALAAFDRVFGVFDPAAWDAPEAAPAGLPEAEIERLVGERTRAREARDFARADELRDRLAEAGVVVEDTPQGPRWKRG